MHFHDSRRGGLKRWKTLEKERDNKFQFCSVPMEEGRLARFQNQQNRSRRMSRNYALIRSVIKVRNYSTRMAKSGHVQSENDARLSPFIRSTPRRSTLSFVHSFVSSFFDSCLPRSIKRRGTRVPIPFLLSTIPSNDFVSPRNVSPDVRIPMLRSYIVECVWSVYGARCFRDFVRHRGCNPILGESGRQI